VETECFERIEQGMVSFMRSRSRFVLNFLGSKGKCPEEENQTTFKYN
jgi:hypothetical protein